MKDALGSSWQTISKVISGTYHYLPNLVIGLIVLWLFIAFSNYLRNFIIRISEHAKLDINLAHALGTLSSAAVNVLGILITALIVVPGFKITHVIAGLGVTSIAVGFAFKDIMENFFAGLILLWQKPFVLGDIIKTGGFEGIVESIKIKSTHLRTEDGELIIIPNDQIFSNPIVVRTAYKSRRCEISISGNVHSSVEANRKTIKQIIDTTEAIAKSPSPEIFLTDINSGNQIFKVRFWTDLKSVDISKIMDQVNTRVQEAMSQPVQRS